MDVGFDMWRKFEIMGHLDWDDNEVTMAKTMGHTVHYLAVPAFRRM